MRSVASIYHARACKARWPVGSSHQPSETRAPVSWLVREEAVVRRLRLSGTPCMARLKVRTAPVCLSASVRCASNREAMPLWADQQLPEPLRSRGCGQPARGRKLCEAGHLVHS